LGLSVRQVRRIQRRYEAEGDAGLIHRSRGAISPLRVAEEVRRKTVRLIEEVYEGFGPTLAVEKLRERDGILTTSPGKPFGFTTFSQPLPRLVAYLKNRTFSLCVDSLIRVLVNEE